MKHPLVILAVSSLKPIAKATARRAVPIVLRPVAAQGTLAFSAFSMALGIWAVGFDPARPSTFQDPALSAMAQAPPPAADDQGHHQADAQADAQADETPLNLPPDVVEQSPVLQRWLEAVPDVRAEIRNDPAFVTRAQMGYSFFPSSDGTGGFFLGLEDWFIGEGPVTFSADYQQNFQGDRQAYGIQAQYYLLPLGDYLNVAPVVGYRYAEASNDYRVSGLTLGVRLRIVPSRTGSADITLDQSWIVGDSEGLSLTQLNAGYAITDQLRLSTDLEWQRTANEGDSRVGINLEWAL